MIGRGSEPKLKVLVFGASLRADSLNGTLAALAARLAQQTGAAVDHASMRDFDVPSYDGDVEKAQASRREQRSCAVDSCGPMPSLCLRLRTTAPCRECSRT